MENKNEKNNNIFLIVIFAIILILVLFMPKIYDAIETLKMPKMESTSKENIEENKNVDKEVLESIHFPLMRNSVYDSNTYYSLDKFTISNMSNNDILLNAYLSIEEVVIKDSTLKGTCTTVSKQFDQEIMGLRVKNVLGKNVNYVLDNFYVPEDSNSSYTGNWNYDVNNGIYVYNGLCSSNASNTRYYNLEELIKAEYDKKDINAYYYVGFAKVIDNSYIIYSDDNMINEINKGTFTSVEDLNETFKTISKKNKKIYKYTFKNNLCSYNEYCLYEGKWVNEL